MGGARGRSKAVRWQRPNIGSRMNREVHVRFWERPEVKALRATRQKRRFVMYAVCPLYPQHRTFQVPVSTSQEGQDRLLNGYGARFDASCIWRLMRLSY